MAPLNAARSFLRLSLLAVAASMMGCSEAADSPRATEAPAVVESERAKASRRGIAWMVANADRFPRGWAHPFLLRIHRVAPDDATAASIVEALRNDAQRRPLPDDLSDPALLGPKPLRPILNELVRRKTSGEPYREQVETLAASMARDGFAFWDDLRPLNQLTFLYKFQALGLEAPTDFDTLANRTRAEVLQRSVADVAEDIPTLYVLTHLVLVRSGYFRTWVTSGEFDYLVPYFVAALGKNFVETASHRQVDLSAEILACLSLMRTPPMPQIEGAMAFLLSIQLPDGSWGGKRKPMRGRAHTTLLGVLATAEPAVLRPDPDLRSSADAPGSAPRN